MSWAALVLGIGGLVVSVLAFRRSGRAVAAAEASAVAAERSADHAENDDRREAERRHAERAPQIMLTAAMPTARRGWPEVILHNRSGLNLDEATIVVIRDIGEDPAGVLRDGATGNTGNTVTFGPVPPYEDFPTRVELDPAPDRSTRLRVVVSSVRCGAERWEGLADEVLTFRKPARVIVL